MHQPRRIKVTPFGQGELLSSLGDSSQTQYLRSYISDLGGNSVLEEPNYFDRDYLSEFSAFYSTSSKGYPNICRRLHFFDGPPVSRDKIKRAAAGHVAVLKSLQESYLGFVVVRPISAAPLGRTVLRWYPDTTPNMPRVVTPSRDYTCHIAGISLVVYGLAWQQQDTAVGACATVGLWTMLHSSAFDDHHSIPTTAAITRAAHKTASLGSRMFPSTGLTGYQLAEAIKEHDLAPIVLEGDEKAPNGETLGFSKERFSSSCAAFVRSGYPVLIIGTLTGQGRHAVCAVGFRESSPGTVIPGDVRLQDSHIEFLYLHDDNIGPGVRFRIVDCGAGVPIELQASPPSSHPAGQNMKYPAFVPDRLLVAAHTDLRTSPDVLHSAGLYKTRRLSHALNVQLTTACHPGQGLTFSARFVKLAEYLGGELGRTLGEPGRLLGKIRLLLQEKVPPMSLHLGVVRIAFSDATPFADVIYDTTDSNRNHPVLATVCFSAAAQLLVKLVSSVYSSEFGVLIEAY